MNNSYSVVVKADDSLVIVDMVNENIESKIKPLRFVFDLNLSKYVRTVLDNQEKAKIFEFLRDIGVLFRGNLKEFPGLTRQDLLLRQCKV